MKRGASIAVATLALAAGCGGEEQAAPAETGTATESSTTKPETT